MRNIRQYITKKEVMLCLLFVAAIIPFLFLSKNAVQSETADVENESDALENYHLSLSHFINLTSLFSRMIGLMSFYSSFLGNTATEMAVVTYNVNSDRYVDDPSHAYHAAFPELSYDQRFSLNTALLDSFIQDMPATIFNLQEMSDAALALFKRFFQEKGFKSLSAKYAPNGGAMNFIVAYDPSYYEQMGDERQIYYTESRQVTPEVDRAKMSLADKKKQHMGQEFERSALSVLLKHRQGKIFRITNTHPGLEESHRLQSMVALGEFLNDENDPMLRVLTKDQRRSLIEFAVGDMNMFSAKPGVPTVYYPQIQALQNAGLNWLSENLMYSGLNATFVSFPYDILRFFNSTDFQELNAIKNDKNQWSRLREFFIRKIEEKTIDILSTCLDGIFWNPKKSEFLASVSAYTFSEGKRVETSALNDANLFRQRILSHFKQNLSAVAPVSSDHFSIRAKITLN